MNKENIYRICIIVFSAVFIISCQKDIKKKEAYRKGELIIAADPSIEKVGKALTEVFQIAYPEITVKFKTEVEDLAIADIVNGEVSMAITSRDLTQREREILYNGQQLKCSAAQIACDAAIFITSKSSSIDKIEYSMLKSELLNPDNKIIFDNGNSINFNTVISKLNLPEKGRFIKAFKNVEEVIDFVARNKNHIGVVSFGILNDDRNSKTIEYLEKVKIIPVQNKGNKIISPSLANLRSYEYPFTRQVFLLNTESGFYVGSTFVKFAGSQRGQLIILKEGLQPYYVYPRKVQLVR